MKFIFLGCFLPDPIYTDIVNNSKGNVSNAADAHQKSIIEGLSETFDNLEIINFPCIGMWPLEYKQLSFHEFNYTYLTYKGKQITCFNPGFLNLYMFSRYDIYIKTQSRIGQIIEQVNETVCLIVYAVTPWIMRACYKIKNKYKERVKIVLIVPDLPEYQGVRKHFIQEVLLKLRQRNYKTYYEAVDGFVFLTQYMAEKIPVKNRPWVVIEGIYNLKDDSGAPQEYNWDVKALFYSGTMNERYGIMNLVNAFCKTTNPNYRLVLCGTGDTISRIKERMKLDNRIVYLGLLSRSTVLVKQKESVLLINPRTPDGEYTKYSFPSKTMEYMASGIPTLIYSLPGIPKEYLNYCFHLEELGVDALYKKIELILSSDKKELSELGNRARKFILEYKNPYKQCAKFLDLIKGWE